MTRRDSLIALRDAVEAGEYSRKRGPARYLQLSVALTGIGAGFEAHQTVMSAMIDGKDACAEAIAALIAQEPQP